MSTIQVRVDPKTKKSAQRILKKIGMDLSGAIHLYLMEIIKFKGIPFALTMQKGVTLKKEKDILGK